MMSRCSAPVTRESFIHFVDLALHVYYTHITETVEITIGKEL